MRARWVWVLWASFVLAACKHHASPACHDADGDGRGVGCAAGPDCDDDDATIATGCVDAGAPDCDADELASGCPCAGAQRRDCFEAAPESAGVGLCHVGKSECLDAVWSSCDGAVLPTFEVCNGLDDDCDGIVDEGVQSPCGGCNADCTGGVWGLPAAPFTADGDLAVTAAGELTLRSGTHSAVTLWVPNTDEGTVSKIDASAASEVARYRTRGANPIRVAVDHRGDAWVLDGSQTGVARLTKIAGAPERCKGMQTAQSPSDIRAIGKDDCVLLDLPLGAAGDDARSLALDGDVAPDSQRAGNVWVGFSGAQRLLRLDGSSGKQLGSVELADFHAYNAAFDVWGVLWLLDRAGLIASVDPKLQPMAANVHSAPFACYTLESFSIDAQGRLLLTGFGCESVLSYDPQRDSWRQVQVDDLLSPRGIVALPTANWLAYDSGSVASVVEPLAVGTTMSLAQADITPLETVALAADTLGQVWAISTQGGPDGRGVATRFDAQTAAVTAQVPVGIGPRGGGDMTGYSFGADFAPVAEASHVFVGCEQADDSPGALTEWQNVHVMSVLGAGSSIDVALRHADSAAQLTAASFSVLGTLPNATPPFPLSLPVGGVVEVRLTLHSPGAIGAPRVARVGVEWHCPGPD